MNIQPLKGFRDFLPGEAIKRTWLREKITAVFEQWGYDPMETPTLEPLELFAGQIGEDEKLFFSFEDQGGRKVALRYDQTVPTCRVVGQYVNDLPMPFRRYQIQPAFRAEKPQKGRYREFIQCDADIFGIEGPLADAETIAASLDIYRQLGFPRAVVLINDRTLLKDIPYPAIAAIDKLKKIGEDGVLKEMETKGLSPDDAKNYLALVKNLKPNEAVTTIMSYLKNMGFPDDWYAFSPTLARSFSYSTGPIWEVEIPGFDAGSVLGGERYDKLIEAIAGKKIPGTGFGLGFDRTLEAAQQFGLVPTQATSTKVLVTVFSEETLQAALLQTKLLREKNISTELYPDDTTKLDKQLKYADRKGIPFVIIIGPNEIKKDILVLKDMKSRTSKEMKINEAIDYLSKTTTS